MSLDQLWVVVERRARTRLLATERHRLILVVQVIWRKCDNNMRQAGELRRELEAHRCATLRAGSCNGSRWAAAAAAHSPRHSSGANTSPQNSASPEGSCSTAKTNGRSNCSTSSGLRRQRGAGHAASDSWRQHTSQSIPPGAHSSHHGRAHPHARTAPHRTAHHRTPPPHLGRAMLRIMRTAVAAAASVPSSSTC